MEVKLSYIIKETFDKEYFLGFGCSKQTENKITKQIQEFNSKFPDALFDFLINLKQNIPNAKIENWTQFFNLDRCIRFLVELDEERRFICQLSIYGYFSIYASPVLQMKGQINFLERKFIERYHIETCDLIYECSKVLLDPPVWIDNLTLSMIVFDLSIPKIQYQHHIKIADILFTAHYI